MKAAVLALAVLACVALASASDDYDHPRHPYGYYGYYNGPYLRRGYHGVAAPYNNAERQLYVNKVAEEEGASAGTAADDGVAGTGNNFGYYGYGYGRPYARPYGYGRPYGNYGAYEAPKEE